MIDHDPRTCTQPGAYTAPSFEELLLIARSVGLVSGVEHGLRNLRIMVVGQVFELRSDQAESMLSGLLLGYFAATSGEDMTAAQWL